jgi:hypothetical protein
MLDPKALQQLVEQQVQQEVADRVATALNEQRINVIEDNAIKFIQDRIVAKFANSEAMPELVEAVKSSVRELFHSGQIPGLGQYVDYDFIKQSVNNSTQELVQVAIKELTIDKHWLEKIETQINQHMIQRIVATLGSTDIRSMVNERVSEITESVIKKIMPGIQDQSHSVEMTVMDGNVVVENTLTARELTAVDTLTVKNLVVKGNVNTDNQSWNELANKISKTTLDKLTDQWKQTLIEQVAEHIAGQGGVVTRAPAVHNKLRKLVLDVADKKKIPYQLAASSTSTGTDTDAFAYSNGGVPSVLISMPLKYMHTTVESCHKEDVKNVIKLIYHTLLNIEENHNLKYNS